jgi:3-oxoacyl-[acyl-carrier-protein] synthase-1
MRRVVVTGIGIVSPIGNNADEVLDSLRAGRSGIEFVPEMAEHGFRSQVAGTIKLDPAQHVDKRRMRFMGPGAAYAHIAMEQAIADAGLSEEEVSHERTGVIAGSGGPSTSAQFAANTSVVQTGSTKRIGPFAVPKAMCSTVSANLATAFRIRGMSYSITSACSTSLHCIGAAAEQIMMGRQDVMFAGGGEELDWTLSCLFDAMGAMSSRFNDDPQRASRAFDQDRDGFVIAGGGGIVVLEDRDRAIARGARIYAEVTGFAATSDGHDMVAPRARGASAPCARARHAARRAARQLHQRPWHLDARGDVSEVGGGAPAFRRRPPAHQLHQDDDRPQPGRDRRAEAIYCLLMLRHDFHRALDQRETADPATGGRDRHADGGERGPRHGDDELIRLRRHQRLDAAEQARGLSMDLSGKRALVMGVANDHSIAWGIAKALHGAGAELAFTYQGEAFGRRVQPLAASVGSDLLVDVDVTDDASLDRAFGGIQERWGGLDILVHAIAFARKDELQGRFVDTSREGFQTALTISCYSLIEVARRARPLMAQGGTILTLTYQGSNRVTPHYNVMGVAKAALESAVRYLANDLGPEGIRVNAISPGPMKTLAGAAIGGARRTFRHTEANSPLRANATLDAIGGTAVWLCSEAGRCTTGEVVRVDGGYHVLGMPQAENL